MANRLNFLTQKAPENYVAGLGRGATGFTTRSDLGPARDGPSDEQIKELLAKRAAAAGVTIPTAYGGGKKKEEEEDENFADADNDEAGLFSGGNFDRDDDEADRIYQAVDERMGKRRQAARSVYFHSMIIGERDRTVLFILSAVRNYKTACRHDFLREERDRKAAEELERKNPKISAQFNDLKRALGTIADEEWANIPDSGDFTGKNKRAKKDLKQRFYAVPDSVLAGARDGMDLGTEIQEDGSANNSADLPDGTTTNLAGISTARDRALQSRLDQAAHSQASGADSISGTSTTIDPKGYLTSLANSEIGSAETQVGDVNRARLLMASVTKTNPKHGPGWIAAARLEEFAGKHVAARKTIRQGCENCPKNEDVWLESLRMHKTHDVHDAKIIAKQALDKNNQSVRLWLEAFQLESTPNEKKRVLMRALDYNPQSVALWKELVNLSEDPKDARLLLHAATEKIPLSVELWLALARLETPDQAQIVLNKARQAVPGSSEIWIAAARLQEQIGQEKLVFAVMKRAVKSLTKESAMLKREDWIGQAELCESEGALLTCRAIIQETLGWGLDEDDERKKIWLADAKSSIARGRFETARAIYTYALQIFYNRNSVWLSAADLERNHGTKEQLSKILDEGTKAMPGTAELWLQLAKLKQELGDLDGARDVLRDAFQKNPESEPIYLAAVQLAADTGETERARDLFARARQASGTDRVWIKSAAYERQLGNLDKALELVNEALNLPSASFDTRAPKLWMLKGQIYEAKEMFPQAREAYNTGTRKCSQSVSLWLLASRLEERMNVIVRARSILDRARLAIPNNPQLWTESVRLEVRAKNMAAANQKMAQALQACPKSGLIWSERIWSLESRTHRKPRILEAIQQSDSDPILFVTAARIFWSERKLDKADNWFQKAIILDPDQGDTWAWYYKFALMHGTEQKVQEIVGRCTDNAPKHGEIWQVVNKAPENVGKPVEEILKKVAKVLDAVQQEV
jgi:pre-mRNA-processing factor 6